MDSIKLKIKKVDKYKKYEGGLRVSFKYNADVVERIKELNERVYCPTEKEWEIPVNELNNLIKIFSIDDIDIDRELLVSITGEDNLKSHDSKRELILNRLEGIRQIRDFSFKTNPFPHQVEGFNYGVSKNALLLADEQGLGKTKQSIDIAVARKEDGVKLCLIVCGVNSVKYNWQKEVEIHSNESAYLIDHDVMKKRKEQLVEWIKNKPCYFAIINIESLRKDDILSTIVEGIKNNDIGFIIVDEVHKAKNGSSMQGKALRELNSKYKLGLTGTPIMNKAHDLWNILSWLGEEKRTFWAFRNRYCVMGGFGNHQVVGYKNLSELNTKLKGVMLRRKKDEVLDLPPKLYQTEYIELSEKHRQLYNEIKLGIIKELDDIKFNPNPLTSLLRLRQCTGGLIGEENPKLDRLKELVNDIVDSNEKVIIFSQWEQVASKIKDELKSYKPAYIVGEVTPQDRQKEVDRFQNDDKCNVVIGTIGAMGTGLTLNKASYVIFLDKAWSPSDNAQAEDRAHRIGTVGTVNIISMVAKDTIDEKIEEILQSKKDLFEQVVEGKLVSSESRRELIEKLLGME